MPPKKSDMRPQVTNVEQLRADIAGSGVTARAEACQDLIAFFSKPSQKHRALKSKEYHHLLEALFHGALADKHLFLKGGKGSGKAGERLDLCAKALRDTVKHGVLRLTNKIVSAVIDHITTTLPTSDGSLFEPLARDYMHTFSVIVGHPIHVENLALFDADGWFKSVQFVLAGISHLLEGTDSSPSGPGPSSRDSPAPGTARSSSVTPVNGRSRGLSQRGSGQIKHSELSVLVQCLLSLVSASNAPCLTQRQAITGAVIRVLRLRLHFGTIQRLAFAILNSVLLNAAGDDPEFGRTTTTEIVPLLAYWWQPRTINNDELLLSVRNEMLKTIHAIHSYLESLLRDASSPTFLKEAEDLLDSLWAEYSNRSYQARLRLEDLSFSAMSFPSGHFATGLFALQPFAQDAEHQWAVVETMSRLESVYLRYAKGNSQYSSAQGFDSQPRKKQRLVGRHHRILEKISSPEGSVSLTALQLIPFFLPRSGASEDEVLGLMDHLMPIISDKQGVLSSWAMVACACCATLPHAQQEAAKARWRQIWQLAVRSVSIPSTCRAACVLLYTIIETQLLPYHAIADDVSNIVTMADICGPAVLLDSSLVLMHCLANVRNESAPSAINETSSNVIRWVFSTWKPADPAYASSYAANMTPFDLVNLLSTSCGLSTLGTFEQAQLVGGPIAQFWKSCRDSAQMTRYLLLLNDETSATPSRLHAALKATSADVYTDDVTSSSSYNFRTVVLELLSPKLDEFQELLAPTAETTTRRGADGSAKLSIERWRSLLSCLVSSTLLVPHLERSEARIATDLKAVLDRLWDKCLDAVLESPEAEEVFELILLSIAAYLPPLMSADLENFCFRHPHLLRLFARLSDLAYHRQARHAAGHGSDAMEVDDEFNSRSGNARHSSRMAAFPRHKTSLSMSTDAFLESTKLKLHLLSEYSKQPDLSNVSTPAVMDFLSSLEAERFLLSRGFIHELLHSDLTYKWDHARDILEQIGEIVKPNSYYSSCDAAWCMCMDILTALAPVWSMNSNDSELTAGSVDFYNFLVKSAWPNNLLSVDAQVSLISLIYHLVEIKSTFWEDKKARVVDPKQTFLELLESGRMRVKFHIGGLMTNYFDLYVVKEHDNMLADLVEKLPLNPEAMEGIVFRVFVLANLGCKLPTLLRRCVFHIAEVASKVSNSTKYATRGIRTMTLARSLKSPQELLQLFAPQLLYTWFDKDSIENIPYEIFDFASLDELLSRVQTEAAALMVMRGQDQHLNNLAARLKTTPEEIVQQAFSKVMAYSVGYGLSSKDTVLTEPRILSMLGRDLFHNLVSSTFADIIGHLFALTDQEGIVEDSWNKDGAFAYAATIMAEIKKCSHSETELPRSQQPRFKGKQLVRQIQYLVDKRTSYHVSALWTPALVTSVARRLLSTIHPALGPHHALSVVRKIRILVCLAGPQATCLYPLEMLLRSIRPFISDTECADDALGISRWLIANGTAHLARAPSFLAGYALSTLASLRMFLESSQASSTQESQFKATINKAQQFHTWFVQLLRDYESLSFKSDTQARAFEAITHSASNIRTSGSSQKDTHESRLLLEILKDAEQDEQLLNDSARDLALRMLCGDFTLPPSNRDDILESDADAHTHGSMVWKSCRAVDSSKAYLTWAGRAVGRSFAASGDVPHDVLRESLLSTYNKAVTTHGDSINGLLKLLANLTTSDNSSHAGRAESAVRRIVSFAVASEDQDLIADCSRSLPDTLAKSSDWSIYHTPPTDIGDTSCSIHDVYSLDQIESSSWSRHLAIHLVESVHGHTVLKGLTPILDEVDGFAELALPFIVHLALVQEFDSAKALKRTLSAAAKEWLNLSTPEASENTMLLINVILYLRSRVFPDETSIIDRARWLDVDPSTVAEAAMRCGKPKIALMFAELALSDHSRTSRRSSAVRDVEGSSELLLNIFENIDDPDAYYGLERPASLSTVLSRLEYEKESGKSLAFRGAQYDSHLRMRDASSDLDGQSLVKILSGLGLAGLADSLLQTHQHHNDSADSLNTAFTTARRLEKWNLPAPATLENDAAISYRAYQSVHKAVETGPAVQAIRDGLASTMRRLVTKNFKASDLRQHLGTLAALTELDDILSVSDFGELESILASFEARSKWMLSGRYNDVNQILSHRQTTLSMLSQKDVLRTSKVTSLETRLVEVRSLLLSSRIYRFHQAKPEALGISTMLRDLVAPSEAIGLTIDAAVKMDEAHSLWEYGEMTSSIRLLQSLHENASSLKKQNVPVSHAEVLSKIGHQVSVAKLETADSIQKKYLEPALKQLKGTNAGKEAGQVFHQFAIFCDEQLQDPEILEDLARLQRLVQTKAEEVDHYRHESSRAVNSQMRDRYQKYLNNAHKVMRLDQADLELAQKSRNEFVRLALENYLQSLAASDDHDNDALRFTALWLQRSDVSLANKAVHAYIHGVPTYKFVPLMNQLSSRLQEDRSSFQQLLIHLVYRICCDHPYHGMYQIWAGTNARPNKQDDVAVRRKDAAKKVANQLVQTRNGIAETWRAIDKTSLCYNALADSDRGEKPRSGTKINIKDHVAATALSQCFAKFRIPPPTLEIALSPNKDYRNVPVITKLEPTMVVAGGVSAPKILTVGASNGERYKQLVKGGDDLRQDAIMEQVFAAVSSLLKQHRATRQRNLGIRTYKVLPLTAQTGIIEFVANTQPLHDWLIPAHSRYYPKDLRGSQCRKQIEDVQGQTTSQRISVYHKVTEKFHPVMRYFFLESSPDPDDWYTKRLAYTRTTAAISILGHVLGLGDRHGHNILLDKKTGEVVHIDLGVAFETGRILPIPEVVPFRMTRDVVDGMGITRTDGVFRRCCEFTLDALREDTYSIMTILDVLRYDPLHSWSSTPMRLAKLQRAARRGEEDDGTGGHGGNDGGSELLAPDKRKKTSTNEPSEADRALEVVRKKLSKTLSVTATVNDLINQATDEKNLAVLYAGWAAYV